MITKFDKYLNNKINESDNIDDIKNAFILILSKINIYQRTKYLDNIIKSIKSYTNNDLTFIDIVFYNNIKFNIEINENLTNNDRDSVKIKINGIEHYNRTISSVGFNYINVINIVKTLFLEILDNKNVSYTIKETKELETTKDGEIKLKDGEWEIDQIISVFTEDSQEYANIVKENALPLMNEMIPKDVKRGDTIYITAYFSPKNKSAAYMPNQIGVLQVRVVDIFMGLSKLKQVYNKKVK